MVCDTNVFLCFFVFISSDNYVKNICIGMMSAILGMLFYIVFTIFLLIQDIIISI